jgi:hypothetical protein
MNSVGEVHMLNIYWEDLVSVHPCFVSRHFILINEIQVQQDHTVLYPRRLSSSVLIKFGIEV